MGQLLRLSAILITILLADAQGSKIASDLKNDRGAGMQDVIIQYRHVATDAHHQMIRHKGGLFRKPLDFIQAGHYTVPLAVLEELANDPEIVFISPDRPLKPMLDIAGQAINGTIVAQYG